MQEEIFRPIPCFEGFYEVSNMGNVKSVKRQYVGKGGTLRDVEESILKGRINKSGYWEVCLHKPYYKKTWRTHRLVAITFLTNPDVKPFVNHINGIKTDNRLLNLEWCTAKENSHHAWRTGLCFVDAKGVEQRRQAFYTERNPKSRKVLNIETGIYYDSASEAWRSTSMKWAIDYFGSMVAGSRKSKVPFIFID